MNFQWIYKIFRGEFTLIYILNICTSLFYVVISLNLSSELEKRTFKNDVNFKIEFLDAALVLSIRILTKIIFEGVKPQNWTS